jgi:hypothetical protein
VGDQAGPFSAEFVEEHVQCSFAAAGSGPDKTAGVVIDHDDQETVPTFVGDLIDPDPTQPFETVDVGFDVIVDPGDDRPDRSPRHPQQLTSRALRGSDSKPGRHRVEITGMASTVSRPRNSCDGRAVRSALDPWCIGFDKYSGGAGVESTPASPASPPVIAR